MQVKSFNQASLDMAVQPPELGYLSETAGAFALDGQAGHAVFIWYHDDGGVDMHQHALAYKGSVTLGGDRFFAYAPSGSGDRGHGHMLILFSEGRVGHDEAHRLFYVAHDHLHLWAWDARCMPLHKD